MSNRAYRNPCTGCIHSPMCKLSDYVSVVNLDNLTYDKEEPVCPLYFKDDYGEVDRVEKILKENEKDA